MNIPRNIPAVTQPSTIYCSTVYRYCSNLCFLVGTYEVDVLYLTVHVVLYVRDFAIYMLSDVTGSSVCGIKSSIVKHM
jgi:hypothetical protein